MTELHLAPLEGHHWSQLYRLMVAQNFPGVPDTFDEAKGFFEKVYLFGAFAGHHLKAGFVFGDVDTQKAFLDVVCTRNYMGKWATKGMLRQLYHTAFMDLGLDYIWAQPKHKQALKACLQAGFIPATELNVEEPVLILTKHSASGKWAKWLM